jgi:hypothetical protein
MRGIEQTRVVSSEHSSLMMTGDDARIAAVERLNEGIMVEFDDGRCVFYPASLLYESIPEAQEQDETRTDW